MNRQYRLFQMKDSGNCYKIRLLMSQRNLPYQIMPIDILAGESRTEEFLAKNQNGRVPTLQIDEDQYLAESNAILWYLAAGSEYFPADKFEQAQVFQWMGFDLSGYTHIRRWLRNVSDQPRHITILE